MSDTSNTLMGQIRSMLHEPRPDATKIILAIEACADEHTRAQASHYAYEHFTRIHAREQVPDYHPTLPGSRMQYDPGTGVLSHPDGTRIKQMCCPIEQSWSDLEPLDAQDRARLCTQCKRHVHDTRDMDPDHVRELVQAYPETCLHIDPRHGHVRFLTSPADHMETSLPDRVATIRTAFSYQEINAMASIGYKPLVKSMIPPNDPGRFIQVWQHVHTGHIHVQMDSRCVLIPPPYTDWEIVLTSSSYQSHQSLAIAAYLIPKDLQPHTPVFIEQSIHPPQDMNWTATSLAATTGIWNGHDIIIDPPPRLSERFVFG